MGTQGVNGANLTRAQLIEQFDAARAKNDFAEINRLSKAILDFDAKNQKAGTEVEHDEKSQPLTEEQKAQKAQANQQQLEEIAQMKKSSKQAEDADQYALDTEILKEQQEQYNTKEKAQEEFGLSDKFKDRRAAKKIAKAARDNLASMEGYTKLEKIYTNKEEYEAAVKKAKEDGTWDKDNPKYTLLDGKALEGAKHIQELAKKKVDDALKSYKDYEATFNNPASEEDKDAAKKGMYDAAREISANYKASQMFDEKGNIDTEAYKNMMLQYAGADFKGNLDERKVLAKDADVKKRHTDNMLEAAGLDAEKDYTWAMKTGTAVLGLGAGALAGILGGGATATAVATAVANASASATANVNWTGMAGDEFNASVTSSTTVTSTATATATKALSTGQKALTGLAGAILPTVIAALAVKDNGGKDAFSGASADEVLNNPELVKGRQNKAIMNQIMNTEITGNPGRDKDIKAAIITAAMSDKTGKKVNTRELSAAYAVVKHLKENPDLVTLKQAESTPPTTTPTTTTPTPAPEKFYTDTTVQTTITHDVSVPVVPGKSESTIPVGQAYVFIDPNGKEHTYNEVFPSYNRKDPTYVAFDKNLHSQMKRERVDGKMHYIYPKEMDLGNGWKVELISDDPEDIKKAIEGQKMGNVKSRYKKTGSGTVRTSTASERYGTETDKTGTQDLGAPGYEARGDQEIKEKFEDKGYKRVDNNIK